MTTKAGERLANEAGDWDYFGSDSHGMSLVDYVAAIEAEAIAAERRRITDGVERLLDACFCDDIGQHPECEACRRLRAVLAIVKGGTR